MFSFNVKKKQIVYKLNNKTILQKEENKKKISYFIFTTNYIKASYKLLTQVSQKFAPLRYQHRQKSLIMKASIIVLLVAVVVVADIYAQRPQRQCQNVCYLKFDPVCGSNGVNYKSFSNDCFLGIFNCKNPYNKYKQVDKSYCESTTASK